MGEIPCTMKPYFQHISKSGDGKNTNNYYENRKTEGGKK